MKRSASRHFHRTASVFLLFILVAAPEAAAQPGPLPGFQLSLSGLYEASWGEALDPADHDLIDHPYSHTIELRGAALGFAFPRLFGQSVGISTTLGYGRYDISADRTAPATIDVAGIPATATTRHRVEMSMSALSIDLMAHFRIGEAARLEIGPYGSIAYSPDVFESERIVDPPGATYADGTSVRYDSSYAEETGFLQGGLALRAGYELPLLPDVSVRPFVIARAAVLGDIEGSGIGILATLGGGISIALGGAAPPEVIGAADDAIATPAARVDLYAETAAGAADTLTIREERTLRRVEVPLDPIVRFERESAALPPSLLRERSAALRFGEQDLIGRDPGEIRGRSVEIIASRLRAKPGARAELVGRAARGEPAWFAIARGRMLREYLSGTWGIDSTRVSISAATDGGEPSVEIRLPSGPLAASVVTEWIEQQFSAPVVGVEPVIADRLAARTWRVSVMWEGREIGVVRNTTPLDERHIDIGMAIRGLAHLDTIRGIAAELVVEDTTGAAIVARDTLTIALKPRSSAGPADEADRYLGEFYAPVELTSGIEPLARHIVATMPARATVVVHAPQAHAALGADVESILRTEAGRQGKAIESLMHAPFTEKLPDALFAVSVAGRILGVE